ncbi:MAG: hypothetical protein IT364_11175 [Candidatus Hydrogenedentes bacterium]|nr:hypothetical protein [Candidatus Hydrogenedentota bacterium]
MHRKFNWPFLVALTLVVSFAALLLIPRVGDRVLFRDLEPDSSVHTFDDFLRKQIPILDCSEVKVRGVTYYHIIGPPARVLPSGGAFYVFDAKGNYIGWSPDRGDQMRHEAIYYPWLLPEGDWSESPISLDELKKRIQGNAVGVDSQRS